MILFGVIQAKTSSLMHDDKNQQKCKKNLYLGNIQNLTKTTIISEKKFIFLMSDIIPLRIVLE